MIRILLSALLLLAATTDASAIVIRDDVDDSHYRVEADAFPALVDLPHEGHGVLIAPHWILTAAHATQGHPVTEVMLGGRRLEVSRVILHPGYRALPQALQHGDAAPASAVLASSDDIALIELAEPVEDIDPVAIYRGKGERGKLVMLYGKGATGNGVTGMIANANRTTLRRAHNRIDAVDERWLRYRFDADASAHPLEGMLGNGDSGGPVLLQASGGWKLAGLASWKQLEGDIASARSGLYGQVSYQVRVSRYATWIDAVMRKRR